MKLIQEINLRLFDLDEVSKSLEVTKVFLQSEIKRGRLKACRLSKVLYISEDSLRAYLNGESGSASSPRADFTEGEE